LPPAGGVMSLYAIGSCIEARLAPLWQKNCPKRMN
jgi:hypothetical protein